MYYPLWSATKRGPSVSWQGMTYIHYIHQINTDTGCSREDVPGSLDEKDELWEIERERKREIAETLCN